MQLSHNEVQVESRKAARGAGLSWGLAEEVGQAMGWLLERGIDALPALLDVLEAAPDALGRDNPFRLGVEVVDRARLLAAGQVLIFPACRHPVLLMPFLATAARLIRCGIELRHAGGIWSVSPDQAMEQTLMEALAQSSIVSLRCRALEPRALVPFVSSTLVHRLDVDSAQWQRLQKLSYRTYVPASERSRRLGAGAGNIDND
jgi:hypothetical protein